MKEIAFTSKNIIAMVSILFGIYFVFIHCYLIWCIKKIKRLVQKSEKRGSETTKLVNDLANHRQHVETLLSIISELRERE